MGKAIVNLHTRLRGAIGKDQVEIALTSDCTLKCLLSLIEKEYPKLKPLLKGEFGYKHLMILINNKSLGAINEDVLEKRINDHDIVSILEPSAAG